MNIVCHKINFSGSDTNVWNFALDPAAVININDHDKDLMIYEIVQPAITL